MLYCSVVDLQCCVGFTYLAKLFSYTYTHIYFLDSFSISVITEYWVAFPVLYSRALLIIYFIYLSVIFFFDMPTWINTWNLISPKWSSWYKPSKPAFPQSSSPQWMAAPSFQLFGIKLLGSSFTFSFEDHVPVTRKFCWFYLKRILGINLHLTLSSAVSLAWSYLAWIIAAASTLVFLLLTLTSFQSVLNSHQVIIVIWISSCSSFAPKPLAPSHSEKPWTPSIFSHPLVASLTLSPINSLSYTLHSSNTGLLVTPQTSQVYFCMRAVSSAVSYP